MQKKWNLQDIRPAQRARSDVQTARDDDTSTDSKQATRNIKKKSTRRRNTKASNGRAGGRGMKYLVVALGVAALGVWLFFAVFLEHATIAVQVKNYEATLDATFTSYTNPDAEQLGFEVLTLSAEGERQVDATGTTQVQTQATGTIVIQNRTSESQRLIKNTRFRSPEGLVFRIDESVVVPAATTAENGDTQPGEVTTDVFADEPGEEYNLAPTEFVIPGYQEGGFETLFEQVTAYSDAPMRGGFDGTRYAVASSTRKNARAAIHEELEDALFSRAQEEQPAGFILFSESVQFNYESLPTEEANGNQVVLKERVTLEAPLFARTELAEAIARATYPGYEGSTVTLKDDQALGFSYASATSSPAQLANSDQIEFILEGKPIILWTFDEEALKDDLSGAAKTALNAVLSAYPAIERAEATIRPFWKRAFPEDADKISVVNEKVD